MIVKKDKSFIIEKNSYPYHVTPEMKEYTEIKKIYDKFPEKFEVEKEPHKIEINERDLIIQKLDTIDFEYRTPRTLADAQLGDENALKRLKIAQELSSVLREKLKIVKD